MISSVGLLFLMGIAVLLLSGLALRQLGEDPRPLPSPGNDIDYEKGSQKSPVKVPSTIPHPVSDVMPIAISVILLFASVYVIVTHAYQAADKHWAYGTVGTLIGYWLKPQKRGR